MMDPTRSRVRLGSISRNLRKYLKLYAVLCLIAILCNVIIGGAASESNFSKNTVVFSKSCKDAQNCGGDSSSLDSVKTPREQSDSLTAFINWLFGPPANTTSKPDLGDKTSANNVLYNRRNSSSSSSSVESKDEQLSRPEVPSDGELKNESFSTRLKREYKPVKVPYTGNNKDNKLDSSELRRRQLLINPWDQQQQQQMMMQQQQQAAAAAAMLQLQQQRQQMDMLNANRNRYQGYLDDYDDDDSDEDSDESDDFSQFGVYDPMANGGPPFVHYQRKLGLGRRSVSEDDKNEGKGQKKWNGRRSSTQVRNEDGEDETGKRKAVNNKFSLRNGDWFVDDYDLNSAFYDRPQERRHLPDHLLDEDRKELDEEEREDANNNDESLIPHHDSVNLDNEKDVEHHLRHRGDLDYIYREFKDSLCKGNECLQPRQTSTTMTAGSTTMAATTSGGSTTMAATTSGGSTTMAATTSGGSTTMAATTSGGSTTMAATTSGGSTTMAAGSTTSGGSTTMAAGSTTSGGSTTMAAGSTTSGGSTTMAAGSTTSGGSSTTSGGSSTTSGGSSTPSGGSSTMSGASTTGSSTSGSSTTTGGTGSSTGTSTGTGASGSSTVSGPSTTRRTTRRTTTTTKKPTTTKPKPPPPYKATLNCRCGTQSVRGDLVGGGTIIRYNVNPWLVSISSGGKHLCSGSLINDRDILTSKACTKNAGGNITVTAGMTSRKPTNYTVTKISTNPKFNLALLRLSKPVKVGHTMRPVCIPIVKRKSEDYSTGMLVTFKKGPPPKNTTLQMIDTEVAIMDASSDKCNNTPAGGICAGPPGSVKCGGDTGGLLQVYRGGYSYEQIGVVAGTVGCRSSSTPGAYTDIRGRARWILNNAKGGNFCKNPKISSSDLSSTIRLGDLDLPFNDDEMEEEIVEDGDNDSIRHSGNLIEDAEDEDQGAEIFDDGEESRDDFS